MEIVGVLENSETVTNMSCLAGFMIEKHNVAVLLRKADVWPLKIILHLNKLVK